MADRGELLSPTLCRRVVGNSYVAVEVPGRSSSETSQGDPYFSDATPLLGPDARPDALGDPSGVCPMNESFTVVALTAEGMRAHSSLTHDLDCLHISLGARS